MQSVPFNLMAAVYNNIKKKIRLDFLKSSMYVPQEWTNAIDSKRRAGIALFSILFSRNPI